VTPTVTYTQTYTATATNTATPTTHTLTVNMNLALGGGIDEVVTVTGGAWGGTCGAGLACTFSVPNGATATVTQTAGSDHGTWSGGSCTGLSTSPCVITSITAAKTVTWVYTP
jgi:hypothetical protein